MTPISETIRLPDTTKPTKFSSTEYTNTGTRNEHFNPEMKPSSMLDSQDSIQPFIIVTFSLNGLTVILLFQYILNQFQTIKS